MKLLFIDDEEELISTIAERLEFREIDADWVTNPDEAVEMIKKKKYDIAVVDVKMPGISGFELKERLEEIDPELKYIFMTGHGSEHNFKKGCCEAGERYYLLKPVNIEYLLEVTSQLMKE